MENNLPEPFKTAFDRGDSIDYRTVGNPDDHAYVKNLGYVPEMHSDCSFSAEGLKGISLSSYGNWGTVFVRRMDETSKEIFLDMYDNEIIKLWRITVYKDGESYKYENGNGWITYIKEIGWKPCECPYDI